MKTTRDGKALYLHCLPADINGVSCVDGEVEASVFDRYREPPVQGGLLQALHHRRHDLPGQGEGSPGHPEGPGGPRRPRWFQK